MSIQGRIALSTESVYYFSLRVHKKTPIFISERYFHILTSALEHIQKTPGGLLLGYVIVAHEIHAIFSIPRAHSDIHEIVHQFRLETKKNIVGLLEKENRNDLLHIFRYTHFRIRRKTPKVWENSYSSSMIKTEKMFMKTLHTIHDIPVKMGLVAKSEHWRFSSARNYLLNDHTVLPVDTQFIG